MRIKADRPAPRSCFADKPLRRTAAFFLKNAESDARRTVRADTRAATRIRLPFSVQNAKGAAHRSPSRTAAAKHSLSPSRGKNAVSTARCRIIGKNRRRSSRRMIRGHKIGNQAFDFRRVDLFVRRFAERFHFAP